MTGIGLTVERSAGLAGVAARWDAAKFGSWLRTGLDIWVHPDSTRGQRSVAFHPLILDPDRDPLRALVDAVQAVPGGLERLRDASAEALATWTAESTHSGDVLDALLRLADRLPSAASVPALRRLLCEGHLNGLPRETPLRLQALDAASKLIVIPEGEALLRDLRQPRYWDSSFAATWLEGMAFAGKIDWLDTVMELRPDLEEIDPTGHDLQPVLRRVARNAGEAERTREQLAKPHVLDEWMQTALFSGRYAPLRLAWLPNYSNKGMRGLTLVAGEDETPIYDDLSENDIFYEIYARQSGQRHGAGVRPVRRSVSSLGTLAQTMISWSFRATSTPAAAH